MLVDKETTLMRKKKEEDSNALYKDAEKKYTPKQKKYRILTFSRMQTPSDKSLGQAESFKRP